MNNMNLNVNDKNHYKVMTKACQDF